MANNVITFASEICGVSDDPVLTALCSAAEVSLENRLRSGISRTDCGDKFDTAAALIAAAAYIEAAGSAGAVGSFKVGSFSMECGSSGDRRSYADALRAMAQEVIGDCAKESGFCFMGVLG